MKSWLSEQGGSLNQIATELIEAVSPRKILALYGELGSGKTTLVKAICQFLGVQDTTSSPTFAIVHEYIGREKVYHFDLFRLKEKKELDEIGFEEYLDTGAYVLIEWPTLAESILWHYDTAKISIEVGANQERIITLER